MEIQSKKSKKFHIEHWQVISFYLMIYDVLAVCGAHFLALWLRFDCRYNAISPDYLTVYFKFMPIYSIICIIVFKAFHLYNSIWRFASYSELLRISMAAAITSIFNVLGTVVTCSMLEEVSNQRMPYSYYFFGAIIQFLLILGVRFAYRFILLLRGRHKEDADSKYASRVMLIGAGNAGQLILRDIKASQETNDRVCCIIDDNHNKWNRSIDGIPVVGGRDDILTNVEKYKIEKIYIAIPSAKPEDRRDILNICKETGCELKNLPGVYQFVNGDVRVSSMKNVMVEDLLGREAIKVNMEEIYSFIAGKVILVTGGGGSIGSELCRQIAKQKPKHLIIFEIYENNAYDIENELRKKYPELSLTVLIGSVRDTGRVNSIFAEYKPEVVYHAAAHKHVPLMEGSACEAIKNNTIGTYKTAYAAMMNGCQRFVLISTDKAVNPTNIMGASKRLCEMVIQTFDRMVKEKRIHEMPVFRAHSQGEELRTMTPSEAAHIKTEFVAVRFGNVLGSNGSVVPLFKKQIAAGGPVTVTHPDIIRYFMTIPEAVSLVLQAGVYAKGGEIFVLDMGEPVKIDTLARNLIKLSGYKPDVDIKIEYTGLRPGEKLFEEKLMAEEDMGKTENQLIHIGKPIEFDTDQFLEDMDSLLRASYAECKEIRTLVAEIVPTYQPKEK